MREDYVLILYAILFNNFFVKYVIMRFPNLKKKCEIKLVISLILSN